MKNPAGCLTTHTQQTRTTDNVKYREIQILIQSRDSFIQKPRQPKTVILFIMVKEKMHFCQK